MSTRSAICFHGRSPIGVAAGSTAEVGRIGKLASEHKNRALVHAGRQLPAGRARPAYGEVVIRCGGWTERIRGASTRLNTLPLRGRPWVAESRSSRARAVDRMFPLCSAPKEADTIGGKPSTNAGGTAALRMAWRAEMALGLEVDCGRGEASTAVEAEKGQYRLRSAPISSSVPRVGHRRHPHPPRRRSNCFHKPRCRFPIDAEALPAAPMRDSAQIVAVKSLFQLRQPVEDSARRQ